MFCLNPSQAHEKIHKDWGFSKDKVSRIVATTEIRQVWVNGSVIIADRVWEP